MATLGGRFGSATCSVLAVVMASGYTLGPVPVPAQEQQEELAWHEVFQKAATWPETMLVSRSRYRKWRALEPDGTALSAVDLALRRIRVSDPAYAVYEHRVTRDWAQLRLAHPASEEGKTVTPLDWFGGTDTRIERGLISVFRHRNFLYNSPPAKGIEKRLEVRISNALLAEPCVEEGWLVFHDVNPRLFAVGNNLVSVLVTKCIPELAESILVEKLEVHVKYK